MKTTHLLLSAPNDNYLVAARCRRCDVVGSVQNRRALQKQRNRDKLPSLFLICVLASILPMAGPQAADPIELSSPNAETRGGFGQGLAGLPDLTGDGIGELGVSAIYETVKREMNGVLRTYRNAGRVYVYNGATAALLYTVESPSPAADRYFTVRVA